MVKLAGVVASLVVVSRSQTQRVLPAPVCATLPSPHPPLPPLPANPISPSHHLPSQALKFYLNTRCHLLTMADETPVAAPGATEQPERTAAAEKTEQESEQMTSSENKPAGEYNPYQPIQTLL